MSNSRLAAIDIGSNTVHMIVVQRQGKNHLKHILQNSRLLKLGLLEQSRGSLPDYAQGSIRRTLESFVRQAQEAGVGTTLVGADRLKKWAPSKLLDKGLRKHFGLFASPEGHSLATIQP